MSLVAYDHGLDVKTTATTTTFKPGAGQPSLPTPFYSVIQCRLSYGVPTPPCAIASCSPCQSSVDCGNTKTPSMHHRLGRATLSQLAFSGETNPNFPREKSYWADTVVKKVEKKKAERMCDRGSGLDFRPVIE